jgi:putative DNA primase/helicase
MRFEDFARSHGLIINGVVPGKWIATPTEDHPKKRNGRYKYMGDHGWVQNWATMQKAVLWKSDRPQRLSPAIYQAVRNSEKEREDMAKKAAARAGWILHNSLNAPHPYMDKKGFPDEPTKVWTDDDGNRLLVVPMRINNALVGVQLIDEQGHKKFLKGQRSKGASFTMDAKGLPIFCEGYATGLSIRAVMKLINIRYQIHVCFSAGNIQEISRGIPGGIVVADNDASRTGENAALETGKPYWISPTTGEDFNDFHQRVGNFKASQSLKSLIIKAQSQ